MFSLHFISQCEALNGVSFSQESQEIVVFVFLTFKVCLYCILMVDGCILVVCKFMAAFVTVCECVYVCVFMFFYDVQSCIYSTSVFICVNSASLQLFVNMKKVVK